MTTTYDVAKKFSPDLGARFCDDGEFSGEEFRDEHLIDLVEDAIRTNSPLVLNFDHVSGMPPSFLEEAFGGLRRARPEWSYSQLVEFLRIEAPARPDLWTWVAFAKAALKNGLDQPKRS